MKRWIRAAVAAVIVGGVVVAGPLSPPVGPVGSSFKTLSEIEPRIPISGATTPGDAESVYRITAPGSYYLTGNIQGVSGKNGIEIALGGVTVDLSGFAVLGTAGSLDGITVMGANRPDIAVVNGSVRGWGGDGVDLANATGARVTDISASANGSNGIVLGTGSAARSCTASANGVCGILAEDGDTVAMCSATGNGFGITASASRVVDCAAAENTLVGIAAAWGSTVSGCSVVENGTHGIQVDTNCVVRGNNCFRNGVAGDGAGIHAWGDGNRVEDNNCNQADTGIRVISQGCVIVRNTCASNTVNWYVVPGNVRGPIVDGTAAVGALVNGNAGGDSTGSSHPGANFSY